MTIGHCTLGKMPSLQVQRARSCSGEKCTNWKTLPKSPANSKVYYSVDFFTCKRSKLTDSRKEAIMPWVLG